MLINRILAFTFIASLCIGCAGCGGEKDKPAPLAEPEPSGG